MEKHSAEFLRGVVFGMHAAGIDSVAREQLVDKYRTLLAQAEAREAETDAAAVIAQCKAALMACGEALDGDEPEAKKADAALSAISAWEAGR